MKKGFMSMDSSVSNYLDCVVRKNGPLLRRGLFLYVMSFFYCCQNAEALEAKPAAKIGQPFACRGSNADLRGIEVHFTGDILFELRDAL